MRRLKIIVAYDGTGYHGWQIQPSDVTVVSTLQDTFKNLFSGDIKLLGASRTDAGVHAIGQVAIFDTDLDIPLDSILKAWNNALPKSILIRSIEPETGSFHIFGDVIQKTYWYHLFYRRPLPHVACYGWFWKFIDEVDWDKFERSIGLFVGEHDFRSFCRSEPDKSTIRKIDSIRIQKFRRFSAIRVEIKGRGFLRYQIRRMVGAALDVARRDDLSVTFIEDQLKNPSDQQNLEKADGCGLCLRKILYK